jgi:hypothetical protein
METVNQENATNNEEVKTFTQEELNKVVEDRLARERAKYLDYEDLKAKAQKYDEAEEASKTELQKATEKAQALEVELEGLKKANELRQIREEVARATNVPANLLTADTKEACEAQAKEILAFAKPQSYPKVKDGGEVSTTGGKSTSKLFSEWMEQYK